jgi:hypothetical protein
MTEYINGIPTMLMFPPRNYKFRVVKNNVEITLPRKGSYNELCPEHAFGDDDRFNIYDEEGKILYFPSITKVLFASCKYPDLSYNQFFAPIALVVDENEVTVIGQVIEFELDNLV